MSATRVPRPSYICHVPFSICHGIRRRRGFSFAEVMFAVVILGIGFIMVAAIFPVAIQQTQATSDDSAGASIARAAANTLGALPTTVGNSAGVAPLTFPLLPPTVKNYTSTDPTIPPAIMVPFVGARWNAVQTNVILASNPRLAYIPFYMRSNGSPTATVVVVAVAAQNESVYGINDIYGATGNPTQIMITAPTSSPGQVSPGIITFNSGPTWQGEGCTISVTSGPQIGRTYTLGRQIQGTANYELIPSDGMSIATGTAATNDGLWNTQDDMFDTPGTVAGYMSFPCTLQPTVAYAKFSFPNDSISGRITLSNSLATALAAATTPANNVGPQSAAPGAFIVVSDDAPYASGSASSVTYTQPVAAVSAMYPANAAGIIPRLNGRIFRLGPAIAADANNPPGTYELDPAYGLTDSTIRNLSATTVVSTATADTTGNTGTTYAADIWARVYIAGGRALTTPMAPSGGYSGAAQAIAAFSTFIPAQ